MSTSWSSASGLVSDFDTGRWSLRQHFLAGQVEAEIDPDHDVIRLALTDGLHRTDEDVFDLNDGYLATSTSMPLPAWSSLEPLSPDVAVWLEQWLKLRWRTPPRWEPVLAEPEPAAESRLLLTLSPALFLRPRESSGVASFYEQIAETLDAVDARSPLGLTQLIEPLDRQQRTAWINDKTVPPISDDPLLPLASNRQQRRVIEQLRTNAAVVVQGPPGTGKTHTIANLICALLADGLRVLVTSRHRQPLKVVHDLLPDGVRDLAVLAQGKSAEDRKDLDRTLIALSELSSAADPQLLSRDIATLRQRHDELRRRLACVTEELRDLRAAEYRPQHLDIDGYRGIPAQVIAAVENDRAIHGWIGELPPDAAVTAPLNGHEADELLQLLDADYTGLDDDVHVPDPAMVSEPATIVRAVRAIAEAQRIFSDDFDEVKTLMEGLSGPVLQQLTDTVNRVSDALSGCGLSETLSLWQRDDWRLVAATDLLQGGSGASWASLQAAFDHVSPVLQDAVSADDRDIDWGATDGHTDVGRLLRQAKRLRHYLQQPTRIRQGGRRIRRLLPAPEQAQAAELLQCCTVGGAPLANLEQAQTVIAALRAEAACAGVIEMCRTMGIGWRAGTHRLQMTQLRDIKTSLDAIIQLAAARRPIEQALQRPDSRYLVTAPGRWDLIVRLVRNASRIMLAAQFTTMLEQMTRTLLAASTTARPGPLLDRLLKAVDERDAANYTQAHRDIAHTRHRLLQRRRRDELLQQLASAHPKLAEHLRATTDPAWRPRLIALQAAWNWARAAAHVDGVPAAQREQQYRQALDETEGQLRQVTEHLAAKRALLHFIHRRGLPQWQALQSYRSAVNRYGRDGGDYKIQRTKGLRSALRDATRAVPALLMRVEDVASDIPAEPDAFDVLIIDEASQVTVDAAFLLWPAPRAVIVGDDRQCTPGFPPKKLPAYWRMANEYLKELPDHLRQDFGPDSNLYELLSTHLLDVVRLVEHFRCVPEIIGWSTDEFYEGRLRPLRQLQAQRLDPLNVVRVEHATTMGVGTNRYNEAEATKIVDEIRKMVDNPLYRGKTIGVILLLTSKEHVNVLNRMIDTFIGPEKRRRFKIRVGDPAAFQGDERDVILLSMVVDKSPEPATRREARQRFNVAATRARDQLWLFTSVPDDQLGLTDLRRSLLVYMENPPIRLAMDPDLDHLSPDLLSDPFESLLEQRVFLELRRRDYTVIAHYPLDGNPIDLLVVGDNSQLAVECHCAALPMTLEDIEREIERERELLRSGWQIVRIRESEYLHDPKVALAPLWKHLEVRGIGPTSLRPPPPPGKETWSRVSMPDSDEDDDYDEGQG
ncbi:hypothetical protein HH310_19900 [Actinoplanes sp. TBRC 11911]|uniref:AAA domain-containing protein n=1 Tax=Actinoplanes sp. TBRC 11911 TaxID=2729386 RepID=UPI00145EBA4C|nr:AAA domain-containing protein [Actinoplanes sp. TBRC 11911]NMO53440.1 hypothetical protein [Actinoplanes sp. TBRC 11911]